MDLQQGTTVAAATTVGAAGDLRPVYHLAYECACMSV